MRITTGLLEIKQCHAIGLVPMQHGVGKARLLQQQKHWEQEYKNGKLHKFLSHLQRFDDNHFLALPV
jgi:hypothetical protein